MDKGFLYAIHWFIIARCMAMCLSDKTSFCGWIPKEGKFELCFFTIIKNLYAIWHYHMLNYCLVYTRVSYYGYIVV